ncbi:MAG: hypothetical protein JST01_21990 [Cyanobacteria bacterium SZAS TMP-1]|nr:hypothetical protein [Cyanobacteria bacterium SZAS TMP-1]
MYDISAAAQISSLFYRLSGASDDDSATAQWELSPGRLVYFQMERDRYFRKPVPSSAQALHWLRSSESRLRWDVANYLNEHVIHEWNLGAELDLCKFQESIVLHTAYLRADLSWELYYEDGGAFGGQIVVAEADPDGALHRIYLAA